MQRGTYARATRAGRWGVTIRAESHRVELAALYEYEYDPETLEFYDQPPPIKLAYEAKHGRHVTVWHTPDYFVIRADAIGWEEWKTEAALERLAEHLRHEVLAVHQLQKTTRPWCPGCFQDWRDCGQAIYDPLLWTLAPVTVCARHKRPLRTICPFPECRRPSPWLGSGYRSRPDHCAHCGGWLGSPGAESGTPEEKLVIEDAVRSHAWIFDALGELIAAAPSMPRRPQREDLLRYIEAAFRLAASRKITIYRGTSTRHLELASGTVLMRWLGGTPPSRWSLLVVCSQMGISPL